MRRSSPPSSSGSTTSSTPPAHAAGNTTHAAQAIRDFSIQGSPAGDSWQRGAIGQIVRGPYRISKAFVSRRHIGITPVYHAFCMSAFLGAFPTIDDAKRYCAHHETRHA